MISHLNSFHNYFHSKYSPTFVAHNPRYHRQTSYNLDSQLKSECTKLKIPSEIQPTFNDFKSVLYPNSKPSVKVLPHFVGKLCATFDSVKGKLWCLRSARPQEGLKIRGRGEESINLVGIIYPPPLVEGFADLPKNKKGHSVELKFCVHTSTCPEIYF